ncbi:MAG TPA: hypothetical protein VGE52_08230 [Pirellulales bacterium]
MLTLLISFVKHWDGREIVPGRYHDAQTAWHYCTDVVVELLPMLPGMGAIALVGGVLVYVMQPAATPR